ncbi:MAG: hypothetical protein QOJ98_2417 [Acidobacteriota bacterium]|jgi:hypothetical protein|nr:hypothetical protein [Acidobacteriota bacterium]
MKIGVFFVAAVIISALWVATPVQAQEVQCLGCAVAEFSFNSYCQPYNGSWPNCTTRCDGYYCSCSRDTSGRCRLSGDGTWYGFRVQDVFYLPLDRPFHTAYRVTRARMTHRPA